MRREVLVQPAEIGQARPSGGMTDYKLPTPVGGQPMKVDFYPSIAFALAYGLLVPFIIYRFVKPDRRTILPLLATMGFTAERVRQVSLLVCPD